MTETDYTFYTRDEGVEKYAYYDKDIEYVEGIAYDCIYYEFSCEGISNKYSFAVVGNGTTNNNNESFNFDETVTKCISNYTKYKIENTSTRYFEKLSVLLFVAVFMVFVGFGCYVADIEQ